MNMAGERFKKVQKQVTERTERLQLCQPNDGKSVQYMVLELAKKVNPERNLTPCRKMDPMDHRPK